MGKEEALFNKGIMAFNEERFYDAHEYWEELWLDYQLQDAQFIQGLIQLAVSYFHLFNQNLRGARSMLNKSLGKFESFSLQRGINVAELKLEMQSLKQHFNEIDKPSEYKDTYTITIDINNG